MNDQNIAEWKSGEIFLEDEYASMYAKHRKYILTKILNNTCFLIKRPIIGIVKANVFYYNGNVNEFIDECYRLSKEKNIPYIEIQTSITDKAFLQFPHKNSGTYIINLHDDIETIWNNLNKKARNQIRQARKKNVEVVITDSEKDFLEWWDIYSKTANRKEFILESYNLTKELFEKKEISRLFVAKIGNKIVSGNLIILSNTEVIWKLGGSDREFSEFRPNHLLQWEIIEWSKKQGYSYYDMGGALPPRYDINGVPIDEGSGEGPSSFKRKFGGEYKEIYKYQIITNKLRYKINTALINARFKLMRHL